MVVAFGQTAAPPMPARKNVQKLPTVLFLCEMERLVVEAFWLNRQFPMELWIL